MLDVPTRLRYILPGIRTATQWYSQHLKLNRFAGRGQTLPQLPTVVLLTGDVANSQKAYNEGITALSGQFTCQMLPLPF